MGCRVVRLRIAKLIAGFDADASDIDVARRLNALVAVTAFKIVVAAGKSKAIAEQCASYR